MRKGPPVVFGLFMISFMISLSLVNSAFSQNQTQNQKPQPMQFYCAVARSPVWKSWEPVRLTYCLKYLTRSKDGRELKIITELDKVTFGRYEVRPAPEIRRYEDGEEVHLQITYILKRADHNKGQDTIPPLVVQYVVERPGKGSTDTYTAKSDPVIVRYVSTVTDPNPDIRDGVDFGNFKAESYIFRGGAVLLILLTSILLLNEFFFGHVLKAAPGDEKKEETLKIQPEARQRLRPKVARRVILGSLSFWIQKTKSLQRPFNFEEALKIEASLHEQIRDLILAEVPALSWGKTPDYIGRFIAKTKDGRRREVLVSLASILRVLQDDLDIGSPEFIFGTSSNPKPVETQRGIFENLKKLCRDLRWAGWIDFKRTFDPAILKVRKWFSDLKGGKP